MATYHFSADVIARKKGQSVVASASYRSGTRLEDERIGKTFDYRARSGVLQTEIIAPDNTPDWMLDRERLWNAVEAAEKRKDAQLAREIEIALPHELSHEKRVALLREFVREGFVSKGMIADVAFHEPDREGDQRNFHAHVLLTMRSLTSDGFGNKARDWNSTDQLEQWRESWANHVNRTLEREGIEARIDHRSLADQGLDREPGLHLGWAASEMLRRGRDSDRASEQRGIEERNGERERIAGALKEIEIAQAEEQEAARGAREMSRAAPPADRPLNNVAGEIRLAWDLTHSGESFAAALEDRGLTLAVVSAEEARASERVSAFARELERYAPRFAEGELVVLDPWGGAYRLNQRTTGDTRDEIDKDLVTVDCSALLSMTDARAALRDARREEFIAERQAERPQTATETKVIDSYLTAHANGRSFTEALAEKGLSLARVTTGDIAQQSMASYADTLTNAPDQKAERDLLEANGLARREQELRLGELVAVNRFGGVHRLNPHKVTAQIERHAEQERPIRGIAETRAAWTADYERKLAERQARREERADDRIVDQTFAANRQAFSKIDQGVVNTRRLIEEPAAKGLKVADHAAGAVVKLTDFVIDILGGMFAPPPARKISAAQIAIDADARREHFRELAAERERGRALDSMRDDIAAGRNLDAASVRQLSRDDMENIRAHGDSYIQGLIEMREQELKRQREGGGRERER